MSRTALIRRFFGDGEYDFRLAVEQLIELEEALDCGLVGAIERCAEVRIKPIRNVLRLGLIGGGLKKEAAFRLVERHVVPPELVVCSALAVEVCQAAARGFELEPLGEGSGEATADASPTAAPPGESFTASPAPPGSAAATS